MPINLKLIIDLYFLFLSCPNNQQVGLLWLWLLNMIAYLGYIKHRSILYNSYLYYDV